MEIPFMRLQSIHGIWTSARQLALSGLALCFATFVSYKLQFSTPTVVLIYLFIAVLQSLGGGFISAAIVSLLAAACLDYFFLPPTPAFGISDPLDIAALFAFLIVSQAIARLVSKRQKALRQSEE